MSIQTEFDTVLRHVSNARDRAQASSWNAAWFVVCFCCVLYLADCYGRHVIQDGMEKRLRAVEDRVVSEDAILRVLSGDK